MSGSNLRMGGSMNIPCPKWDSTLRGRRLKVCGERPEKVSVRELVTGGENSKFLAREGGAKGIWACIEGSRKEKVGSIGREQIALDGKLRKGTFRREDYSSFVKGTGHPACGKRGGRGMMGAHEELHKGSVRKGV